MNRSLLALVPVFFASTAQGVLTTRVTQPLRDLRIAPGHAVITIPLDQHFAATVENDQGVRFTLAAPPDGVSPGSIDLRLFTSTAPATCENFLKYVTSNRYTGSFIHRHQAGFVLQGGGYYYDGSQINTIPTYPPVANEFGASNTLGTVAMAKLGTDPNSATSQWFINLADNSANLDAQNGGFTVFAKVTQATMPTVAALTNVTDYPIQNFGGAFTTLPVHHSYVTGAVLPNQLEVIQSVTVVSLPPENPNESTALTYTFTVSGSGGPATVTQQGNSLLITPAGDQTGSLSVKVTATNVNQGKVEDTFVILPAQNYASWRSSGFSASDATSETVSGPNADPDGDGVTNLELFMHGLPVGRTTRPPIAQTDFTDAAGHHPRFTFAVDTGIIGGSYGIERSTTLGSAASWVSVPVTEVSRTTSENLDNVTIQPTAPLTGGPAFYRLRFTAQ